MDKEIKEAVNEIINKIQIKLVKEAKEKIKSKKLTKNLEKLENITNETKELIQNNESFEKDEFRQWILACSLVELDLNHMFHEYMQNDIENLIKNKEEEK